MYILLPNQLKQADKATIKKEKITSLELMERAATECFSWLHSRLNGNPVAIHVFCGIGNNGGDGLVITRHLHQHGYNVKAYIVNFSKNRTEDFLSNYNKLKNLDCWPTIINSKNDFPQISDDDLIIDAIFGNGLSRPPENFTKELIIHLNNSGAYTIAIDLPSGIFGNQHNSDTDSIVKANHTLTFQTAKLPFLLPSYKDFIDTWEIIDIGLDAEFIESLKPKYHIINKEDVFPLYKFRNKWSHKGDFGHSMIIGGSYGKIGAVSLASKAALKIGSGLTSAYIPKCGYEILQSSIPEVMVEVDDENTISYFNFKTKPTVIGIGPGLGTHDKTLIGLEVFLQENRLPLVIDADAINLLSQQKNLLNLLPKESILTPHPKELERLIGKWEDDFDKLEKAKNFSSKYNCILVIKGAHTVIVFNDSIHFNSTGNPGLAKGGSGDVLTGIITGLLAQKYIPIEAAILGVYLHGKSADIGVQETGYEGFTATDIINFLPEAIFNLLSEEESEDSEKATSEDA